MGRTVDLSVPGWLQRAVAVTVVALITSPFVAAGVGLGFDLLGVDVGWSTEFGVAAGLCAVGVAVLVWHTGGEDDDSVWGAIPAWQYAGRHAESGGITRSEQERALEELQEREE